MDVGAPGAPINPKNQRQRIAMTSLMIWAVVGGGFAWLWYRQLDWDRILA